MDMRKGVVIALVVLAAVGVLGVPALFAQDAAPAPAGDGAGGGGAPPAAPSASYLDLIINGGGVVGYIILAMSVASLALAIEFAVTLKRDKFAPPEILVELETLLEEEQYEEAIALCESSKNYMTTCLGASLAKLGEGHEKMVESAMAAMDEENLKLMQKIGYESLIGNVAPMMGLFGTVQGMIDAFITIATKSQPSPAELATGIYVALVTTFQGLMVAIPALAFLFYFKNKAQRITFELGGVILEFVERFKAIANEAPAPKQ